MIRLRRLIPLLLVVLAVGALVVWSRLRPPPPAIILISIDSTRPDRLGVYGNTPDVSPNIDALAQVGAVFQQVLALSPWTLPSHMSMLTGLDPVAHGVRRSDCHLSGKVQTLAEALRDAGYRTAAFTDGGFVSSMYGFGQGFEVYRDKRQDGAGAVNGFRRVLPEALDWMRSTRHEKSFVFIHTFDVHTPYDEGDPAVIAQFRKRPVHDGPDDWQLNRLKNMYEQNQQHVTNYERIGELLNDYDSGVHEADDGVGRVIAELKAEGRYDNALIIVTSDHGESFAERGIHIGHGLSLTDDELHVPLVIHLPHDEGAGKRLPNQVDLLDIAPTALDYAGVPAPKEMEGESLLGLLRGKSRRRDYTFGESQNTAAAFLVANGFKFISPPSLDAMEVAKRHLGPMSPPAPGTDEGLEYECGHLDPPVFLHYDFTGDPLGIRDTKPQIPQLYDRAKDPLELHNLFEDDKPQAKLMADKLKDLYEASQQLNRDLDDGQTTAPFDPHIDQQLNALGYLGNNSNASSLLNSLPRTLREEITNPYQPPDNTSLVYADRAAQAIRVRIADGDKLPPATRDRLEKIGDDYITWFSQHRNYAAHIVWRLEALRALAEKAGLPPLDDVVARWQRRVLELQAHPERGTAHAAEPAVPITAPVIAPALAPASAPAPGADPAATSGGAQASPPADPDKPQR